MSFARGCEIRLPSLALSLCLRQYTLNAPSLIDSGSCQRAACQLEHILTSGIKLRPHLLTFSSFHFLPSLSLFLDCLDHHPSVFPFISSSFIPCIAERLVNDYFIMATPVFTPSRGEAPSDYAVSPSIQKTAKSAKEWLSAAPISTPPISVDTRWFQKGPTSLTKKTHAAESPRQASSRQAEITTAEAASTRGKKVAEHPLKQQQTPPHSENQMDTEAPLPAPLHIIESAAPGLEASRRKTKLSSHTWSISDLSPIKETEATQRGWDASNKTQTSAWSNTEGKSELCSWLVRN